MKTRSGYGHEKDFTPAKDLIGDYAERLRVVQELIFDPAALKLAGVKSYMEGLTKWRA